MEYQEKTLACIEVEPQSAAQYSIIWLHGLGADGSDFAPIVHELNFTQENNVRFIFPHAPVMPVSLNHGYEMRAWFDIYSLTYDAKIDMDGVTRSVQSIEKIIYKEISRGIAFESIFLAGFSQGAAIALVTGVCFPKKLGGIIALSSYLPHINLLLEKTNTANHNIPIFLAHGTDDLIIPYAFGSKTHLALKQAGYNVEWHTYDMQHSVCQTEISDIRLWLKKQMVGT